MLGNRRPTLPDSPVASGTRLMCESFENHYEFINSFLNKQLTEFEKAQIAIKLTEIHMKCTNDVSIEKGDTYGHGLYLGVGESLNKIATALDNIAEAQNKGE